MTQRRSAGIRMVAFVIKSINNPKWQVEAAEEIINKTDKVYVSSIVIAETEWVLESIYGCAHREIYSIIHELANNTKFFIEDWSSLNNALLDYIEFSHVELSDCLIAR